MAAAAMVIDLICRRVGTKEAPWTDRIGPKDHAGVVAEERYPCEGALKASKDEGGRHEAA